MVSDPEGDTCDNPGHRGCGDRAALSTAVLDCRCAQTPNAATTSRSRSAG